MDQNDKVLQNISAGSEIKVSVDVYGQSIAFTGDFIGLEDSCLSFKGKEDGKVMKFPVDKINSVEVLKKIELSSTNSDCNAFKAPESGILIIEIKDEFLRGQNIVIKLEESEIKYITFNLLEQLERFDNNVLGLNFYDLVINEYKEYKEYSKTLEGKYSFENFKIKIEKCINDFLLRNKLSISNTGIKPLLIVVADLLITATYLLIYTSLLSTNSSLEEKIKLLYIKNLYKFLDLYFIYQALICSTGMLLNENDKVKWNSSLYFIKFLYMKDLVKKIISLKLFNIWIQLNLSSKKNYISIFGFFMTYHAIIFCDHPFLEFDDYEIINEEHVSPERKIVLENIDEELKNKYECLDISQYNLKCLIESDKLKNSEFIEFYGEKFYFDKCLEIIPLSFFDTDSPKRFFNLLFAGCSDSNFLYDARVRVKESKSFPKTLSYLIQTYNLNTTDIEKAIVQSKEIFTKSYQKIKETVLNIYDYFSEANFIIYKKYKFETSDNMNNPVHILRNYLEYNEPKFLFIKISNFKQLMLQLEYLDILTDNNHVYDFVNAENCYLDKYFNIFSKSVYNLEDPVYSFCRFYLDVIIDVLLSSYFSSYFYAKYNPMVMILFHEDSVSYNPILGKVYIPIEVNFDNRSQSPLLTKLLLVAETCSFEYTCDTNINQLSENSQVRFVFSLPTEGFYFNLNSLEFDVDTTVFYKFKKSYDFDEKKFSYEESSARIHQHITLMLSDFKEIHNEFQNYRNGSVIKDKSMFFGREKDIESIITNLRDDSGRMISNRCVCIYGQTRTGKSSLLFHLKQRLILNPDNIIVDLGDVGVISNFEVGFKRSLLDTLADCIEFEHTDFYDVLKSAGFDPCFDEEKFEKDPDTYFDSYLKNLNRNLKRNLKEAQVIILIDEFTYIYDWIKIGKLSPDFMKLWKAVIQNYDICAVIVGQDHMMKFINDPRFTNSFGAIKTMEINYLRHADAAELIRRPLARELCGDNSCIISTECVDYLTEMTCGSAYLLMNICADFVDYLNELHCNNATLAHAEDFIYRNLDRIEERLFEPLYNDKIELDSDKSIKENKRILQIIAHNSSASGETDLTILELTDADRERLNNLKERHVVDIKGSKCSIRVRLYAEWLRKMTEKI